MNRVYGAVPAKRFCVIKSPLKPYLTCHGVVREERFLALTLYPEVILLFMTAGALARRGHLVTDSKSLTVTKT